MNKNMSPTTQIAMSFAFLSIGTLTAALSDSCVGFYLLFVGVYAGGLLLRGLSRYTEENDS